MVIESPAVITGGFGLDNFGDDILMLASLNVVRRVYGFDEITVLVYPGGDAYCRRLQPAARFVPREVETQIRADVVIYGGGTQFYHFAETPIRRSRHERAMRFLNGLRFGRMSLRTLWRKQKPTVEIERQARRAAISLGLGPFGNSQAEQETRALLGECEFLSVRDPISMDYSRRWELPYAIERADFGFSPELWGSPVDAAARAKGSKRIGIVVRDWYRNQQGFSHLAASIGLAESLENRGYEPEFFVFDGQGDTTCVSALSRRQWRLHIWTPRAMTIREQMRKLAECELLVTARAHGAIVGATLGVPSVCIEIEPKLRIMAESLGDAGAVWSHPFQVADGVRRVEEMYERLDASREAALLVSQRHGESANQSADELEEFLQSCRNGSNHAS